MEFSGTTGKWINPSGRIAKAIRTAPITAAAVNSMPTNRSPLPKNTVAKNRSSLEPRRSRNTPINHKNAIPANGNKFSANAAVLGLVRSHDPGSSDQLVLHCERAKRR